MSRVLAIADLFEQSDDAPAMMRELIAEIVRRKLITSRDLLIASEWVEHREDAHLRRWPPRGEEELVFWVRRDILRGQPVAEACERSDGHTDGAFQGWIQLEPGDLEQSGRFRTLEAARDWCDDKLMGQWHLSATPDVKL